MPNRRVQEIRDMSAEQREILEKRGVLRAEEIHRLATKTAEAVGAGAGRKAACHSDLSEAERARVLQGRKMEEGPA